MSKYSDIIEQIKRSVREDGGAAAGGGTTSGAMSTGAIGPTTAQDGNTSISYIPGGLSRKKKARLGGVKKVEDCVNPEMLNEQRSEMIHNIYNKLMRVMTVDLRDNKQIKKTIVLLNYWLSLFPNSRYLPISLPIAVNLGSYDRSIRDLISRIKNIYSDDIGNLQMLMNTIQNDMPLNAFEPFAEFEYVVGVRVHTEYEGIVMIPELTVNLAMIPTQTIYVESSDVIDELSAYRTVKILKDMVFPVGQMFAPSVFHNIKDIIDNMPEQSDKRVQAPRGKRK